VGPSAGLDGCGKLAPTGIRSPDRPARSESLYRLSYPGPHDMFVCVCVCICICILYVCVCVYIYIYIYIYIYNGLVVHHTLNSTCLAKTFYCLLSLNHRIKYILRSLVS